MSPTREKIIKHLEKYRELIKPDDKQWMCLEIGIDGDEKPSGSYKHYGKGNTWKTMDFLERVQPDIVADITDIDMPPEQYDLIICTQTLEHIFEVQDAIDNIIYLTKPGGYMILDNPWGVEYHGQDDYDDFWRISLVGMDRMLRNRAKVISGTQDDNLVIMLARKK